MATIGSLVVNVEANTAQMEKGLDKARRGTKGFAGQLRDLGRAGRISFSSAGSALSTFGRAAAASPVVAGIAAGLIAAGLAAKKLVDTYMAINDAIRDVSKSAAEMGLTVEEVSFGKITTEQALQIEKLDATVNQLKLSFTGLGASISGEITPAIIGMTAALADIADGAKESEVPLKGLAGAALSSAAGFLGPAAGAGAALLNTGGQAAFREIAERGEIEGEKNLAKARKLAADALVKKLELEEKNFGLTERQITYEKLLADKQDFAADAYIQVINRIEAKEKAVKDAEETAKKVADDEKARIAETAQAEKAATRELARTQKREEDAQLDFITRETKAVEDAEKRKLQAKENELEGDLKKLELSGRGKFNTLENPAALARNSQAAIAAIARANAPKIEETEIPKKQLEEERRMRVALEDIRKQLGKPVELVESF